MSSSSSVSDIENPPRTKTKSKKRSMLKPAKQIVLEETEDSEEESYLADIDESDSWVDIDMRDGQEGLLLRTGSEKRVLKKRYLTTKEREAKEFERLRFEEWLLRDILRRRLPGRKTSRIEMLPLDVKYLIFDELWADDDVCSSVCFGLACKMFYAIHRRRYMGKISLDVRTIISIRDDVFVLRKNEETGKEMMVVRKGPWLDWAGPSLAELLYLWMNPKYIYNPITHTYQPPSLHDELGMLRARRSYETIVPENLSMFAIQPIILILTPPRPPPPAQPLLPPSTQSPTLPTTRTEIPIPFLNPNIANLPSNFLAGNRYQTGSHVILMKDREFKKIVNSDWEGMDRLRFTRACGWWRSDLVWDGEEESVVEFCGWRCPGVVEGEGDGMAE